MAKQEAFYNPFARYEWVEYIEDDAEEGVEPFKARIRSNLTIGEADELTWDVVDENGKVTNSRALFPMFAQYVIDWNLKTLDAKSKVVDIEPPATGGPEQFQYLPNEVFLALIRDIKIRSTGRIDPKRLSRREPAVEPTSSTD